LSAFYRYSNSVAVDNLINAEDFKGANLQRSTKNSSNSNGSSQKNNTSNTQ
jgi:hypothetical protein